MHEVMLGVIVLGVVCTFVAVCIIFNQRSSEIQQVLQMVAICTFLAFAGYAIEITAKSLDGLIAGVKLGYMGKCFVIYFYLLFISRYGKIKINKHMLRGAFCINVVALILIMTCEFHTLYYKNISAERIDGFLIFSAEKGVCYYGYMLYCLVMFVVILEIGYRNWKNSNGERKKCSAWFILAAISPGVTLFLYLTGVVQFFDLTPLGLLITCFIILFTVKRYGILNAVQIAKDNILENTKDGMIIVDDEYNFIFANAAANIAFPELLDENIEQRKRKVDEIFRQEESVSKIGDKHYEIRISRLYEERALRGYLAWVFDMEFIDNYANEIIKLKEAAERANQAKSTFLANMSHEIRTPMNAVMGLAELILHRNADEQVNQYAKDIKRSSTGLLNIINDILDISKIEAGKYQILPETYYTQSLLNDTLVIVAHGIATKNLELITHFDAELPYQMYGDVIRVRQILVNILNNAIKYTNHGSITFEATQRPGEEDCIYVEFRIKDTGAGIKKENLNKLFNQFEQLDVSKNKGVEGTGLGLTIVKELLHLMNGKIQVFSEYGKGSEFVITIPQKKVGSRKLEKLDWHVEDLLEEEERIEFSTENASALVVDDNELNLEITKGLLAVYGIDTQIAGGGREAIEMAKKNFYDIIFMDCMMPEMDGITAMKLIKEELQDFKQQPVIIALTANAIVGVREEMKAEGFDDYMSKPIKMTSLEDMLIEYLPKEKVVYGKQKSLKKKEKQPQSPVIQKKEPKPFESELQKSIALVKKYIEEFDFEGVLKELESWRVTYPEEFSQEELEELVQAASNYDGEGVLEKLKEKL